MTMRSQKNTFRISMEHPKDDMTITKCLRKLVLIGQIFGYFPVQDIYAPNQKFSYISFRMLYSIFSLVGPVFLAAMQVNKASKVKVDITQIDYVAKYVSSAYVAAVFIDLAKKWPKLMESWRNVDDDMKSYGFPKKLNTNIVVLMCFFMAAFSVEFSLHQASRVYRAMECHDNGEKAVQFFFSNLTLSHVFAYIPYNIPTSLIFQYLFCQMEFAFTYTDIFVMVICICLASRIKQVAKRIKKTVRQQISNKEVWIELRKDYTRLESLCQLVNDKISNIILVSFLPNVFTILTQVYSSLKPKQNFVEAIYFYFSLGFLISRTVTVCICGAMVYEESRKPLIYLNSVLNSVYNEEIDIFINQLLNCEISMNGKHFFDIKRDVILELAGAIVTYELVIIQFNQESLNSWAKSTRCE